MSNSIPTPEKIKAALAEISPLGLNLFASCALSSLPEEMQAELIRANVPVQEYSSLCLFGHGGRRLWENIQQPAREENHPVDTHSLQCLELFLERVLPNRKILLLYPGDTFMVPLQRLGRLLHLAQPSPLGIDLNHDYGPWFAYRLAFLSSAPLPELRPAAFPPPCDSCAAKPCLTACPSGATGNPFGMSLCADYRLGKESRCSDRCLARISCPYQEEHRYSEEQIRYHMLRPSHLRYLLRYRS